MLKCPFCKSSLALAIESIGKFCPNCKKNIFEEIQSNFKKFMDFGGKFIRVNHQNKSYPFIKAYRLKKQEEFFFEKGSVIAIDDTMEIDGIKYQVMNVSPFFSNDFHFAEKAETKIIEKP